MDEIQNPLIYVVDDDQDEHLLLKSTIEDQTASCEIRCFNDGTDLITHLTHRLDYRLPDLILLDLQMPILSGYDVLRLLKRDADWKGIPVIVNSASTDRIARKRCIELGCSAFLDKSGYFLNDETALTSLMTFQLTAHEN